MHDPLSHSCELIAATGHAITCSYTPFMSETALCTLRRAGLVPVQQRCHHPGSGDLFHSRIIGRSITVWGLHDEAGRQIVANDENRATEVGSPMCSEEPIFLHTLNVEGWEPGYSPLRKNGFITGLLGMSRGRGQTALVLVYAGAKSTQKRTGRHCKQNADLF